MKHAFSILQYNGLSESFLRKVLPEHFEICVSDKSRFLIIIKSQGPISSQEIINELQRELDRISFFIGHLICFEKEWEENDNVRTKYSTIGMRIDTLGKVPDTLDRQAWNPELSFQLCLWRVALLSDIPYPSEINLLFQIIEISNLKYPKYKDSSLAPDPLTEARLLRNLVSHKQAKIKKDDLEKYCDFLGIPIGFHDPTDKRVTEIIRKRIKIVKAEAQKIISNALSYSSD